ncbi:heme/hemin ABC transporter substrate-binding protein [Aureimonas pseudogalii]|uniref:Iron complex transport system substrate-binding protein n=1 Tax=Aureimonas pseudogalii TaxID=1744844 RepID=A0A7W6H913_9HYPH|nr:ABC transporter substrate-binding protein [Aureimonas pseudogalii]MBB4000613.1 iron complex transport system substrate-binding protein [Aureimonas pseudogalii]
MRPFCPAALLTLALVLAGLSAGRAQADELPRRIVSIGGAITEILYALGEGDRVAAVDTTSLHPPEVMATKPNVGYMRALSAEGVLSLSPDLILMDEGAGPPEAVTLIDDAGVPVRHVPTGLTVPSLLDKVRTVASAVGRLVEGEAMATAMAAKFATLETALAEVERRRRVLFILSLADGRPNAAGRGTGADAVIRLAGATNVFDEVEGYKILSSEALAALQPDVILMVDRAGSPLSDPLSVPALAATPAGQAGAVIRMDGLYLLGFGPRTPDAVRDLAARLYPELAEGDGPLVR